MAEGPAKSPNSGGYIPAEYGAERPEWGIRWDSVAEYEVTSFDYSLACQPPPPSLSSLSTPPIVQSAMSARFMYETLCLGSGSSYIRRRTAVAAANRLSILPSPPSPRIHAAGYDVFGLWCGGLRAGRHTRASADEAAWSTRVGVTSPTHRGPHATWNTGGETSTPWEMGLRGLQAGVGLVRNASAPVFAFFSLVRTWPSQARQTAGVVGEDVEVGVERRATARQEREGGYTGTTGVSDGQGHWLPMEGQQEGEGSQAPPFNPNCCHLVVNPPPSRIHFPIHPTLVISVSFVTLGPLPLVVDVVVGGVLLAFVIFTGPALPKDAGIDFGSGREAVQATSGIPGLEYSTPVNLHLWTVEGGVMERSAWAWTRGSELARWS
ncbi:hypothetical protein GALMADRAFT_147938 [Galerina marginata CBS 339.88]|uniref:Uncharacterized protein n=1 Tax=Galerina marginata (strain CBS 339.88) TaxID=685588 RepID=A0A067S690_GALM3|nr:hypothetical protein GALMADRAFT_147938 [Galerina marginata CBS 339.88]